MGFQNEKLDNIIIIILDNNKKKVQIFNLVSGLETLFSILRINSVLYMLPDGL